MVESPMRVLIVDDDESMRITISAALAKYQLTDADSAGAAQACLQAGEFDAVVCDLVMPGMTGVELYEWLPVHSPLRRHFLFMTGGALPVAIQSFVALSQVPLLRKPFGLGELREAVSAILPTRP